MRVDPQGRIAATRIELLRAGEILAKSIDVAKQPGSTSVVRIDQIVALARTATNPLDQGLFASHVTITGGDLRALNAEKFAGTIRALRDNDNNGGIIWKIEFEETAPKSFEIVLIGTTTTLVPKGRIAIEILADNRIGEIIFKKGQVGGRAGFKVHAQGGGDFTQVAAGGAVANRALIIDAGQATFKGNVSISYNSISGRPAPRQFRVDYENNSPVLQVTDNINANGRVWVAKRVKVVDREDVVNIKRLVFAETGGGTFGVFSKMPEFTVKNTDRMVKPKTWSIE